MHRRYFLDSLFADIDALALYVGIHPKPDGRLYCTLAKRFPFAVYYDVQNDIATVISPPLLPCWIAGKIQHRSRSG